MSNYFYFFLLEFPFYLQQMNEISEGDSENPITLNIQSLNFFIQDNNLIIYNPSSSIIYNTLFFPTIISFFQNYGNKKITKLNDTSFIVTGIKKSNLYYQIFNIGNNQTSY